MPALKVTALSQRGVRVFSATKCGSNWFPLSQIKLVGLNDGDQMRARLETARRTGELVALAMPTWLADQARWNAEDETTQRGKHEKNKRQRRRETRAQDFPSAQAYRRQRAKKRHTEW
jgi:hypothetical protein